MTSRSWVLIIFLTLGAFACGSSHDPTEAASAPTPTSPSPPSPSPPSPSPPSPNPGPSATGCARTSIGVAPLIDLRGTYKGESGGLYGNGMNALPAEHLAAGLAAGRSIGPLDASGAPSAGGRYALVSIGMSNTTQEFSVFKPMADSDSTRNPRLVIVDGAQGGMAASQWASPGCGCWSTVDQRLRQVGLSPSQVAVAWIKLANADPTQPYPIHAQILLENLISTVKNLKARYPNVQMAYLSSRVYGGYATTALNPEPFAYEGAFAVRNLILGQIMGGSGLNADPARGAVTAPWLAWGPYLWADGLQPRSDGLTWACSDFGPDGTHPSDTGRQKVANMLLTFVRSDPTARLWYSR